MKILFLDQSGKLGGAELSLADLASFYRDSCLVGLFDDGPFEQLLSSRQIPVRILTQQKIAISKDSGWQKSFIKSFALIPLIYSVTKLARSYDVIYANTQKALVVGALASGLSQRPLVYHLRDILSTEHFSKTNITIAIALANQFADLVIANSKATQSAFIDAGGRADICHVVYNGFVPERYQAEESKAIAVRQSLGLESHFIVGHFSRLSPWKGQHILVEALSHCPPEVTAILVGDALFGEDEYVDSLHAQIRALNLESRIKFLGFRSDIAELMSACHAVVHTSTASEPFGRVIVEAMLCGTPVVAAAAGGATELIETGRTGWLCEPGNVKQLAETISQLQSQPDKTQVVAQTAQTVARDRFNLQATYQGIEQLLHSALASRHD